MTNDKSDLFVLSRHEAARRLGLSLPTIDRLIRRGEIQARTMSRRVLVPAAEVERFLDALPLAGSAKPKRERPAINLVAGG